MKSVIIVFVVILVFVILLILSIIIIWFCKKNQISMKNRKSVIMDKPIDEINDNNEIEMNNNNDIAIQKGELDEIDDYNDDIEYSYQNEGIRRTLENTTTNNTKRDGDV